MTKVGWGFLLTPLCLGCAFANTPGVLADYQASPLKSPHGPVQQVELRTPDLLLVDSHVLAFHSPGSMLQFRFTEPVWVIAYQTEIHGPDGKEPAENYLCHTFFGNQKVEQLKSPDGKVISDEMRVLFSDAFTRQVRLPQGFGLQLSPEDSLDWMPMFNNRGDRVARVGMRAKVHFIREKDLGKPLRPLHTLLKAVRTPHLFFVDPGRHEQETTFELPFDGRIHFIGAHIHPYAASITLFNVSRRERVWRGLAQTNPGGQTSGMDTYSSAEGYPVRAGETFRLTSAYQNPTQFPIDAMAGVFLFFSKR